MGESKEISASENIMKDATNNIVQVYVNEFSESSYKSFRESFLKAEASGQTIIPIIIDSFGGNVFSLFAMLDILESSELPVATICTGKALSCGAVLLAAGDGGLRWASPLSRIMIHEAWSIIGGSTSEIINSAESLAYTNNIIMGRLDYYCGKKEGYWKKLLSKQNNTDLWMSAEAALSHKLIDNIGMPRISAEVEVYTKIG